MPPKKQDVPVPEVEDEVDLPEDLLQELGGSYPAEPQFCLVLGHLAGHSFRVPSEEEGGPPQDFDPCAVLLNQVKQSGDAAKSIVLLDKEELQGYCTEAFGLQDQPLWAVLKFRLEKERAARQRQKSNALRRKLISEFEDPELKAAGGEGEVSPPEVDALFLLDAPADAEELQAMSDAGLYEVVDLWTNIYFAGETLDESEPPVQVECPMGEVPQLFFQAIGSAAASTDLANCTVSVVPESHQLAALEAPQDSAEGAEAPPAVTTTPVERVTAAMMEVLAQEASSRMRFQAWLQASLAETKRQWQDLEHQKDCLQQEEADLHHQISLRDQEFQELRAKRDEADRQLSRALAEQGLQRNNLEASAKSFQLQAQIIAQDIDQSKRHVLELKSSLLGKQAIIEEEQKTVRMEETVRVERQALKRIQLETELAIPWATCLKYREDANRIFVGHADGIISQYALAS